MQVNILIVEDELLIAEMLKRMLTKLGHNVCKICTTFEDTIAQLETNKNIDLVFLDINLKQNKNGIDIGYEIKNKFNLPFIYLTSYSDPKSIKKAAKTLPEAYLTKPFNEVSLLTTLEVIKEKIKRKDKSIIIKDGHSYVQININTILLVKKDHNYLDVFTTNKKYIIRQSIEQFLNEINMPTFVRVHRSYAVQLKFIDAIKNNVIFIKSYQVPLSRLYKKEVLEAISKL